MPDPPWLITARAEIGQREILGSKHNPRIQEYLSTVGLRGWADETAWCGAFVAWCLLQHGIQGPQKSGHMGNVGPSGAWAPSWDAWGVPCSLTPGAIVRIHRKLAGKDSKTGSSTGAHVGFWVRNGSGYFVLLGGNQADSVKETAFISSSYVIDAIRWPSTYHSPDVIITT